MDAKQRYELLMAIIIICGLIMACFLENRAGIIETCLEEDRSVEDCNGIKFP